MAVDRAQLPIAPRTIYVMRAYDTVGSGYVYWQVLGVPDPAGVLAPVATIVDVVIDRILRR
jgi:hypothetical protein